MYRREEILKAMADIGVLRDFSSRPIPSEVDHMILALLREVKNPASYQEVLGNLSSHQRSGLEVFGWRACSWAVRERLRELLVLGLVALARVGLSDPDVAITAALHWRSAYLIGVPHQEVFEEAARIVGDPDARGLRAFLRGAGPKSEPVDGFREVGTGKEFRYEAEDKR